MKFETPIFIYNKKKIIKNAKKFIKKNIKPFYAIKANYNKKIIKILKKLKYCFEVVSIGELNFLKKMNIKGKKIIFSGVCKEKKDIKEAIKKKIGFINIESLEEIKILNKYSKKYMPKILFKINLNIDVKTNKKIKTCIEKNKFGMNKNEFKKSLNYVKEKKIKIYGLSFHLGSQIKSNKPYLKGYKKINEIIKKKNIKIRAINIGGGFSIKYKKKEKKHNLLFLNKIVKNKYKIFTEPGRYIVGDACVTIAKVIRIKKTKKKNIAIINIGMDSIIRPALYGSFHKIKNFMKTTHTKKKYEIVGPICESTDVFSKSVFLYKLKKEDLLIIKNTGAYCLSMRMKYNMRKKPKEIFI